MPQTIVKQMNVIALIGNLLHRKECATSTALSNGEQKTSVDVLLDVVMERNINKVYVLKVYRMVEKNLSMKLSAEEVE